MPLPPCASGSGVTSLALALVALLVPLHRWWAAQLLLVPLLLVLPGVHPAAGVTDSRPGSVLISGVRPVRLNRGAVWLWSRCRHGRTIDRRGGASPGFAVARGL